MSCHYPMCMMGGGHCPDQPDCEEQDRKRYETKKAQRERDIAEQEARTRLMNAQAEALEKENEELKRKLGEIADGT